MCVLQGRHLVAGQWTVVSNDALVAGSVPDVAVAILGDGSDIARLSGVEPVNVLAIIGNARFLCTNPQQVGVVDIDALHLHTVGICPASCHIAGFGYLHLMGVDIHSDESCTVGSNPDVIVVVLAHTVDAVVNADAVQS